MFQTPSRRPWRNILESIWFENLIPNSRYVNKSLNLEPIHMYFVNA